MKPSRSRLLSLRNSQKPNTPLAPFVRGFLKRVLNSVAKHNLWQQDDSFIVAVSGGPDSLCLLDVLYLLSLKFGFSLHVAHVNYRLRGKDSDLDEALVRERVALYRLSLSVLHPRITHSANLEERLRDIRYRFFEKVRLAKKATLIAVAHHEDDQAETLLLRLLRGSGSLGLSAMRPKHGVIVRPLLEQSREAILHYLDVRGLSYRTDQSNSDRAFLRNRIRHELLPLLKRDYQPRIVPILRETATRLATDFAHLGESPTLSPSEKTGLLSVRALLTLSDTLLQGKLRHLLRPYCGNRFPSQGVINEVLKLLKSTKNKPQIFVTKGLKIERKGDRVRLLRQGA